MSIVYEIHESLQSIESTLMENDGFEPDGERENMLKEWLERGPGETAHRLERFGRLLAEIQARCSFRSEEGRRLRWRAEVDRQVVVTLRERLREYLEARGLDSFETTSFKFKIEEQVYASMTYEARNVPQEFMTVEIDREKLRKALESGRELSFARLHPRGLTLRLR
ncbi:MAG: siphovirus Gp157 family protein [Planctomycetota bacterium]|nr:siphovirus Gp157 family protein [Planctomycetota bacterium]